MMIPKLKFLSIAACAVVGVAILAGCNDTLRQFIVTVPKPGGTPASQANAVVLSTNPAGNGSNLHIDVSGDDIAAVVPVGVNPIFLGKEGPTAVVINADGTINSYLALLAISTTIHTSVSPSTAIGPIAGGTSSSGNFFITNMGSNDVSVLSAGVAAVTTAVPVGATPVAVAGNAANSKIYVINQGDNTVTVISTVDNAVIKTIPVGVKPIWGVMSADAVDVFVVNQGDGTAANPGSISVIDTTLDQVIPCTAALVPGSCNTTTGAISVGNAPATSSPNFAFFDPNRQRLYVTNTGENTISVIKADGINLGVTPQVVPQLLANISLTDANGNPHTPVSVTALSDGSKAYAALGDCPAGTNQTNLMLPTAATGNLSKCGPNGQWVSVIDATGLRQIRSIQVGPGAVSVASSGDATRVYAVSALDTTTVSDNVHNPACATGQPCGPVVGSPNHCQANCIGGAIQPDQVIPTPSVSIIRTSTDQIFASTPPLTDPSAKVSPFSFRVPLQNANCTPALNTGFNQTVPIPCPGQEAFMVQVFP